jgi:hypothetical protein
MTQTLEHSASGGIAERIQRLFRPACRQLLDHGQW